MSEKRFRAMSNDVKQLYCIESVDGEMFSMQEIVDCLNEQQATIEHLTKSRNKWRELSNSFLFYCKCYEKAIERAFEEKTYPTEDDINRIYTELEKELEDE